VLRQSLAKQTAVSKTENFAEKSRKFPSVGLARQNTCFAAKELGPGSSPMLNKSQACSTIFDSAVDFQSQHVSIDFIRKMLLPAVLSIYLRDLSYLNIDKSGLNLMCLNSKISLI
jgi:hypothetical protein